MSRCEPVFEDRHGRLEQQDSLIRPSQVGQQPPEIVVRQRHIEGLDGTPRSVAKRPIVETKP